MLPVRVGNATGGESNIVILVDVSGSAESGLSVQKAVALDVLDQLGDENQVGVVAFNQNAYRVSEMQALGQNRAETADKIRRLESGGATDIAVGLQGADELLDDREGTIILLSDGQDRLGPPAAVANQLGREGTRVVSVGVGKRVGVATMRQIASESGGSYFAADETERLRLLFGGSSRRYQGEDLTIVTEDTSSPPASSDGHPGLRTTSMSSPERTIGRHRGREAGHRLLAVWAGPRGLYYRLRFG